MEHNVKNISMAQVTWLSKACTNSRMVISTYILLSKKKVGSSSLQYLLLFTDKRQTFRSGSLVLSHCN